jgi:hypothetical protein
MPTKLPKAAPPGRLIGYARVSTEEQGTDPHSTNCARPAAPRCLRSTPLAQTAAGRCWRACCTIQAGETLVVVRLDRLARCGISVSAWRRVFPQIRAFGAETDFGVMRNYVCPLHHSCGPRQVRPHGRTLAREAVLG